MMKFLQLIYLHYFVSMVIPPALNNVLMNLKYSTVSYIPALYPVPDAVLKFNVPNKLYDVIGDYSFLRTAASSLTLFVVLILIYLVIKALSLPEINRSKDFRLQMKNLID